MKLDRVDSEIALNFNIPDSLKSELAALFRSYPDCVSQSFNLGKSCQKTKISLGDESILHEVSLGNNIMEFRLDLTEKNAWEIVACAKVMYAKVGLVIIPALLCLRNINAFEVIQNGHFRLRELYIDSLQSKEGHFDGHLWSFLYILTLQGWLEETRSGYVLTKCGQESFEYFNNNFKIFSKVQYLVYHVMFNDTGLSLSHYEKIVKDIILIVDKCKLRNVSGVRSPSQYRLKCYILYIIIYLSLTILEKIRIDNVNCRTKFRYLSKASINCSEIYRENEFNHDDLCQLLMFLKSHNFVNKNNESYFTKSPLCLSFCKSSHTLLTTLSYQNLFKDMEKKLFGDILSLSKDKFVDREMNVVGSASNSLGILPQINTIIINSLFNSIPIAIQPIGVADIGCGDGKNLLLAVEYIIASTKRGKDLTKFPLHVLAVDKSFISLQQAENNLKNLDKIPGVTLIILQGDITYPDEINESVKKWFKNKIGKSGKNTENVFLNNFLILQMFVSHQRELLVNDHDEARSIIEKKAKMITCDSHRNRLLDNILKSKLNYNIDGILWPSFVIVADFINFIHRWLPYIKHGLILVEFFIPQDSPWNYKRPAIKGGYWRSDLIGSISSYVTHCFTNQVPLSYYLKELSFQLLKEDMCFSEYGGCSFPRLLPKPENGFEWENVQMDHKYYSVNLLTTKIPSNVL